MLGICRAHTIISAYYQCLTPSWTPGPGTCDKYPKYLVAQRPGISFFQGGYALLLMGQAWKRVFPTPETSKSVLATPGFAVALQAICFAAAVALWVLGIWFIIPSLLVLRRAGRIPFAMPWWGMVFPTVSMTFRRIRRVSHTMFTGCVCSSHSAAC